MAENKMLIIGLTGKTGAGKSTIANILKSKGCYIIDGDVIARRVTEKGSDTLICLAKKFGSDIISSDGSLDRRLLAERAFASKENTAALNSITHPAIMKLFSQETERARAEGYRAAVIDAAALLESDCKSLCRTVVVVTAPEDIRLERILKRDNITREQALTRINAQQSDEYYHSQADIIIRNYPPYDREDKGLLQLEELISK